MLHPGTPVQPAADADRHWLQRGKAVNRLSHGRNDIACARFIVALSVCCERVMVRALSTLDCYRGNQSPAIGRHGSSQQIFPWAALDIICCDPASLTLSSQRRTRTLLPTAELARPWQQLHDSLPLVAGSLLCD